MEKYLSILTNFGCHFKCPYCIVKRTGIDIPRTTVDSLDGLEEALRQTEANIISVSGGGDPLHEYNNHKDFYERLWKFCEDHKLPLEMHTSYIKSKFDYGNCYRVVYHLRNPLDLTNIRRHGSEKIRVVFVATEGLETELIISIAKFCMDSKVIDELSFRQMVDENYNVMYYNHELLKSGHGEFWHYIEQGDYNTYYVDGKLTNEYESLRKGESERS